MPGSISASRTIIGWLYVVVKAVSALHQVSLKSRGKTLRYIINNGRTYIPKTHVNTHVWKYKDGSKNMESLDLLPHVLFAGLDVIWKKSVCAKRFGC